MLVRSASTPVIGALLQSGSHSPAVTSPAIHFLADSSPTVSYHPPSISCRLTPGGSIGGLCRACSDGNLAALGATGDDDRHHQLPPCSKPTALETIQSFTQRGGASTDEEEEEEEDEEQELSFGNFQFSNSNSGSTFAQEHPLFLARGLGIDRLGSGLLSADGDGGGFGGSDGGGGGGAGGSYLVTSGNGGNNRSDIEMHYKKMIEEDPCNGLFLRNYAQFLYQMRGDSRRAEEYYSRAILADPNDGELLSEYAKLIWDVHRDEERASSYFERAAKASPQNSHVLAAHAAFLWDTDDGDEPEGSSSSYAGFATAAVHSSLASATT